MNIEKSSSSKSVGDKTNENGLEKLLKNRRSDRFEDYEEDVESYHHTKYKRKRHDEENDELVEEEEEEGEEEEYSDMNIVNNEKNYNNDNISKNSNSSSKKFKQEVDETDSKAWNIMLKTGYKLGAGLGQQEHGRLLPIQINENEGRLGFGAEIPTVENSINIDEINAEENEIRKVEEFPEWYECSTEAREYVEKNLSFKWIVEKKPKRTITDEVDYCDGDLIRKLIDSKDVFNHVEPKILNDARSRANPIETVKAGFFQNRAAMKTANLDKIFGWQLSREFEAEKRAKNNPILDYNSFEESQNENTDPPKRFNVGRDEPIFYFADICAGPGGFSEYLLWRKAFYNTKGFGFTLMGKEDFKLSKFKASSQEYFEAFYGSKGDGNIMDPENLSSLENYIKLRLNGGGVDLVMCDGGFSVEGQENLQEILSKRLYLCQFIAGLSIGQFFEQKNLNDEKRQKLGGDFLCKLFDIFTPFSIGLIYLMHCSYQRISLHKPLASRPANSERYIFCQGLTKFGATIVKDYLIEVNNRLEKIAERGKKDYEDVYEIVPHEIIKSDVKFVNYVKKHIEKIIKRQIFYLQRYRQFAKDKGAYDSQQGHIREQCLKYWELPSYGKSNMERAKQPITMTLRNLLGNRIEITSTRRTPAFNLNVLLNRKCNLHSPGSELRCIMLPEAKEPMLLVSNGTNELFVYDEYGQFQKFSTSIQIPYDTIILAQETTKYNIDENGLITSAGQLIYVIDAAVLNGDDVSELPYPKRLKAAKKFCLAVNKFSGLNSTNSKNQQRSIKIGGGRERKRLVIANSSLPESEIVCAEAIHPEFLSRKEISDKIGSRFQLKPFKGSKIALFEFVGQQNNKYWLTCRGVRFVNLLKYGSIIISSVNEKLIIPQKLASETDKQQLANGISFMEALDNKEDISDLTTTTKNSNLFTNFYDFFNSSPSLESRRVWFWSWQLQHQRDFGIMNILKDESHPIGCATLKSVNAALTNKI